VDWKRLSSKALFCWRFRLLAGAVSAAGLSLLLKQLSLLVAIGYGFANAAAFGILWWFYLPRMHRNFGYKIYHKQLQIQSGVIYHRKNTLTDNQIQWSAVRQGPVQQLFQLADVEFYLPGRKIRLHDLPEKDAFNLAEKLYMKPE